MCRTAYVSCAVRARKPGRLCAVFAWSVRALSATRPHGPVPRCMRWVRHCTAAGPVWRTPTCARRCSGYNWFRGYNCCNGNVDATYNQCRAGRKPPLPALPRKSSRCPAKPAGTSSSRKAPTPLLSPRQRCGAVSLLPPHPRCAVSEVSSEQAPSLRDAQRVVHSTAAAASVRVWL